VRCKNVSRISFVAVTIHAFDRETDRQTDKQTGRKALAIPYVALHAGAR